MTGTPNDEADDAAPGAVPDRAPAEGGRDEVDDDLARAQHDDAPPAHADPDYDRPGDNPLAAEDDDDRRGCCRSGSRRWAGARARQAASPHAFMKD